MPNNYLGHPIQTTTGEYSQTSLDDLKQENVICSWIFIFEGSLWLL